MHVLVVEDDAVLADGLTRVLAGHGMLVDVVRNGSQADALLQRADASDVSVLVLTARDAIEDRVRGLELGADDYLVKPFASAELVARLKALVRRNAPKPAVLALGDLTLDTSAKRARIKDRVIELSVREWAVLEYLLQHGARVVSKQQIIDAILPFGEDLTLNAVEVYISRVRLKIADAGISIRTIRGFGYMLEQTADA